MACIAFSGSAFASSEVVNDELLITEVEDVVIVSYGFDVYCSVTIDYIFKGRAYSYNGNSCSDFANQVAYGLSAKGYFINGKTAVSSSSGYQLLPN